MAENKFKCDICKKYYKSYQSLWHHKNRYHSNIPSNIPTISPNIPINIPTISPNIPINIPTISPNIPIISSEQNIKKIDKRNCEYCNKILSSYKNLHRHQQTCKFKKQEKENEELKKELIELKKMVAELINTKSNITNNTNNTNNSNNTTNNNNGTINNNYITIVPFGKENFVEVTTEKEHLFILKQKGNDVIYKCIEMKHFNEKLPQFHNYVKTNNRTDDAKIYDDIVKDFKIVNNNEIVDDVIINAENDLEDMYNLHETKINNKQKDNVNRIIADPYLADIEKKVKTMPYNYRNKVLDTHKKNKSIK